MKKAKVILMVVLAMVIVTGCGSKSPTDVVNSYFSEIKSGKNDELTNYVLENTDTKDTETETAEETEVDPKMEEAMELYFSKLNVKVLSENIDGDNATVEVEVIGLNYSNIIMELLQESLASAFNGVEMTDEDMSNSVLDKVNNGKEETRTGTISLSKVDKEWKINTEDESYMGLILGKAQGFDDKEL